MLKKFTVEDAKVGTDRLAKGLRIGKSIILGRNTANTHLLQIVCLGQREDDGIEHFQLKPEGTSDDSRWKAQTVVTRPDSQPTAYTTLGYTRIRNTRTGLPVNQYHLASTSDQTDAFGTFVMRQGDQRFSRALEPESDTIHTPRVTAYFANSFTREGTENVPRNVVYSFIGRQEHPEKIAPYTGVGIGHNINMLAPGVGLIAHQYEGEGAELFKGMPYAVPVKDTIVETMRFIAEDLIGPDRVLAVVGRAIDLKTLRAEQPEIINR